MLAKARMQQGGVVMFAACMAALGVTAIAFRTNLPGLQPGPVLLPIAMASPIVAGLIVALASLALLSARTRWLGAWTLFTVWLGWLLIGHLPKLSRSPEDVTLWVSTFQAAVFGLTAVASMGGQAAGRVHQIAVGCMLIVFGAVHVSHTQAISSLLPSFFPMREVWPWITGPVQILAGIAIGLKWHPLSAAIVISGMFLSWVAVLHVPRVLSSPSEPFEWTFMLIAGALAGAVWLAGNHNTKPLHAKLTHHFADGV